MPNAGSRYSSSQKWLNGPWPRSWSRPAARSVSSTSGSDGVPGSTSASVGYTCRASSPARCMVPRLWAKRLCSAVGNTHHELCSWWMRLRRCTHGLSMTSGSAISPARDSVMRR